MVAVAGLLPAPVLALTDADVIKALDAGREYLIKQSQADGSFGGKGGETGQAGVSALVFMTLAYMGEHPANRPYMARGLDFLLNQDADTGFGSRQGYAAPIRVMGLSYIHNKLLGDKRTTVRKMMELDIQRFIMGQANNGGWRYKLDRSDYDFSVTQWPILAMREANLVGIEFPTDCLLKARKLYYDNQNKDGGWHYQTGESYGSMTAAGLASLFIINDVLDPSSGCPCAGGKSRPPNAENARRMDAALDWLGKNFSATTNPNKGDWHLYWLYCVERVGIAGGYKYFGDHNWYKEGAEQVIKAQRDGHWGDLPNTCFALLFLYKGRAPVLFNKLRFDGIWNAHRRDIANLTTSIERSKEQQFHWQIVELRAPLEELHEAPVLYITAESAPRWDEDPAALKQRPEILGINDGVRTCVFYAMDDISCAWQTKALTGRKYLFDWGTNLYTYATDGAPLRAKLAGVPPRGNRYTQPVKAGPKTTLRIARVKHEGNWETGANYGGFKRIADYVKQKAGITLEIKETTTPPVNAGGVAPTALGDATAAYITGSTGLSFKPEEKAALAAYADKGGFLWFEATGGSAAFDTGLRQLAGEMGWGLQFLPNTHGLLTGRMGPGTGYNLTSGVEFRQGFRMQRLNRQYAEFIGVFAGDKMIGVYSPLDIVFSATDYEAFRCRGYKTEDAEAVATNLAIYLSTLK
jgi:hypothetical protein